MINAHVRFELTTFGLRAHGEHVSIKRVRELRTQILNETRELHDVPPDPGDLNSRNFELLHASP